MKPAIYTVIAAITLFFVSCTQKSTDKQDCNFGTSLVFKNGKATVTVKAIYTGATASSHYMEVHELHQQKKLNQNIYFASQKIDGGTNNYSGSAIGFVTENCKTSYNATTARNVNTNNLKAGQTVYLKCTFYQDVKGDNNVPFCLIDSLNYKLTDVPKTQGINPLTYLDEKYIRAEQGCGYFSNDADLLLNQRKCVLMITPKSVAYIQTTDGKTINFNYKDRVVTETGFIDTYKNDNSSFQLNITKIFSTDAHSLMSGKLTLNLNNNKTTFNIYGLYD